jgi:hypothetical protein
VNENAPIDKRLEATLAPGGIEPPVGRYRLDLKSNRWAWSDEVYAMHGFRPGEVVPTTELMISHKHPDDRARVDHVLREAAATGEPFSSVHRIYDAQGEIRTLAVTGQGRRNPETGELVELVGYFIDVTEAQREAAQRIATRSIKASAERRASIEQAKGVLMVAYSISSEEAFQHLRRASNDLNIAVRDLAQWLVHWFSRPGMTKFPTAEEIDDFLAAPLPPNDQDSLAV